MSYLLLVGEHSDTEEITFRFITAVNVNDTMRFLQNGNPRLLKSIAQFTFDKNSENPNSVAAYLGIVLCKYQLPSTGPIEWYCVLKSIILNVVKQITALRNAKIPLRDWKVIPEPMANLAPELPKYPRNCKIQVDIHGNLHASGTVIPKVLSQHVQQALEKYRGEVASRHNIVLPAS